MKIPEIKVIEDISRVTLEWKGISFLNPIYSGSVGATNHDCDYILPVLVSYIVD